MINTHSPKLQNDFEEAKLSIDAFQKFANSISDDIKTVEKYLASESLPFSYEYLEDGAYGDVIIENEVVVCQIKEGIAWDKDKKRIKYISYYYPIGTMECVGDFLDCGIQIKESEWESGELNGKFLSDTPLTVRQSMHSYLNNLLLGIAKKCNPEGLSA